MRRYLPLFSLVLLAIFLWSQLVFAGVYNFYVPVKVFNNSATIKNNITVLVTINNSQLVEMGYINSSGLDTEVYEGTLERAFSVADSRLAIFISSLEGYQQDSYEYRLGVTPDPQTGFSLMVGSGGFITVLDDTSLEPGSGNFTVDWQGFFDDTKLGSLLNKLQSYGLKVDTAGTVYGYTASGTNQTTQAYSPNSLGDYDNIAGQFPSTGDKWSVIDDPSGGEDDDSTYMFANTTTEVKGVWGIGPNLMEGTTFAVPDGDVNISATTSATLGGARFIARYHPTGEIWVVGDSGQYHYPINTWVDEGVCTVSQGGSEGISIAADEDNTTHCLRSSNTAGVNDGVRYANFPEGGSESSTETVSTGIGDAYSASDGAIAIDSNGDIHTVWSGEDSPGNPTVQNIAYRVRDAGTDTWSSITWITDISDVQYAPSIAIDSSDNIHVAWLGDGWGSNPSFLNIEYRKKNAGAAWETIESITDINAAQHYLQLAVDGDDNPNVVWGGAGWGTNTSIRNIRYRLRTDVWQSAVALTDLGSEQSSPSIAINSDGVIHVVWYGIGWGVNSTKRNIIEREYSSSAWQSPVVVIDRAQDSWHPKLVWATWPKPASISTQIPDAGYLFVFVGDDDATGTDLEYYASGDVSFPTASTASGGADFDSIIDQVRIYFRARGTDGGDTYYVVPYLRLDGLEIQGTTVSPGTSYTGYNELLTRPGGGSWLVGDLVNLQIGVGLRSTDPTNLRVTQVYVDITYTNASDEDGVTAVVTPGAHRIRLTRTNGTLELFVDEVSQGTDASVPDPVDNTNSVIVGQYGPASYTGFANMTVAESWALLLQPTAMVVPTNVVDRSASGNTGVITWGTNPTDITVTVGAVVSIESYVPPGTGEERPEVIPLPSGLQLHEDPSVTGSGLPIFPLVERAGVALGWTSAVMYGVLMLLVSISFGFAAMVATGTIWGFAVGYGITAAAAGGTGILPFWIVMLSVLFVLMGSYAWDRI